MALILPAAVINQIEGFIDREEGIRLAELAAAVPADHEIVEIGSASGSGLMYLLAGARAGNGAHVTGVDPYRDEGEAYDVPGIYTKAAWKLLMARAEYLGFRVHDDFTVIQLPSLVAVEHWQEAPSNGKPIGLLHLDGLHDFTNVSADLAAWSAFMPAGAVLALHDLNNTRTGVARLVREVIVPSGQWERISTHRWSRYPKRRGQWFGRKR